MPTGSTRLRDWLDSEKEPERSIAYEMSEVLVRIIIQWQSGY